MARFYTRAHIIAVSCRPQKNTPRLLEPKLHQNHNVVSNSNRVLSPYLHVNYCNLILLQFSKLQRKHLAATLNKALVFRAYMHAQNENKNYK